MNPPVGICFCAPGKPTQAWLDAFKRELPEAEIWAATGFEADAVTVKQADYAVVWAPPDGLFASQRKLKAVFVIGAGVDGIMKVPTLPPSLPVIRLNDAGMAAQMAEFVCHALFRHAREFDTYAAQAAKGEWLVRSPIERTAWPVGIMGLGAIGSRVAQAVRSFGYPVFGWSRTMASLPGIVTFAGSGQFDAFLASVRVLVCLLPLSDETVGILNRNTLSKLKAGAYLINVGRGRHLVEADLFHLLDQGALAGASLDVAIGEPLAADHPFWRHPKITLTPHISAITLLPESVAQIAQKIRALQREEPVEGMVERRRGY